MEQKPKYFASFFKKERMNYNGKPNRYNYNGKLKSAEVLLKEDGSTQLIRRAETPADYFATFDCFDIGKKLIEK